MQNSAAIQSCSSPVLLFSGDVNTINCKDEVHTDDLMKDFLNLSGDNSDGSYQGENYDGDSLELLSTRMELQFLSEQLGIAITGNEESPLLDRKNIGHTSKEIYEAPNVSSLSSSSKNDQKVEPLEPPAKIQLHSASSTVSGSAANKPRLRWTLDLPEQFIEAVNKLDGAEKATPKGVLNLMNVEGLTIYHKYQIAKYLPERKEDKKASCQQEKKTPLVGDDNVLDKKRSIKEVLQTQIEFQKQLHEQLEVQRKFQLRIEEHARYLQKILEEQQKASKSLASMTQRSRSDVFSDSRSPSAEQADNMVDSISPPNSQKHKATDAHSDSKLDGDCKKARLGNEPEKASSIL